jgi:hypothetical protein
LTILKELDELLRRYSGPPALTFNRQNISLIASLLALGGLITAHQLPAIRAERLEYRGGHIHQYLTIRSLRPVAATWVAEIVRAGIIICKGSGIAAYEPRINGESRAFTPSQWTGDQCPDIRPGDRANAVWIYRNVLGLQQSTSAQATLR